ncbi:competence type IV pilus major pilin ComGC [Sulfoacidibacillus ferrooxidans]|uniref:Prepilin-type N-terminal cleavage/methylation domain-containing protein n=1 Tax=Sulfoacidibacillus ferrooxidans TaxID=2005001 RepID=A0A9X1V7W1_9BACL|nr:hypothetical protein [Sulfoacidibacillus ferrooxidans]
MNGITKHAKDCKGRLYNDDGFTLIEMVIALFIAGVMMAVALPNLEAAGVNATQLATQSDEKMISAALTQYYLNYHVYPTETTVQGDLADLKTAGYLDSIPTCPTGGNFIITISPDGTTATVTCSTTP